MLNGKSVVCRDPVAIIVKKGFEEVLSVFARKNNNCHCQSVETHSCVSASKKAE